MILEDLLVEWVVLVVNMEMVVNVFWDVGLLVGDCVVVIGVGVVGLFIVWFC